MSRLLVILHSPAEPLGELGPPLTAAGHDCDTRIMPGSLPTTLAGHAGLVVMGGGMGAYETEGYPFLAEEIRLLRETLAAGTPTLGVCLGSQLLAAAGGARVYRGEAGPEVGWLPVARLADDPWLEGWPRSFEALHWHGDTFDLPAGAEHLASSARYPHQAFRLGSALGLQFHVEATVELARAWMLDPDLPAPWRPPGGHLERTKEAAALMGPLAASLGRAFAEAALRPPRPRRGTG